MKFSQTGIIVAAAIAGIASSALIWRHAQARWQQQGESLHQQSEQSAQLSAENERLSNLIAQVKDSHPLSREQLSELLKLRNEVSQLRKNDKIKTQLQETNSHLRAIEEKADKQLADAQALPNYWPKDQLSYAGYSNPESAMRTMLAAMVSGDVKSWRQSCTPDAVAQLENEWKNHGLSEAQQQAELKEMSEALVSQSVGFHIVDQNFTSPDEAIVNLSFDGEGTTRKFVLRKIGNEWKFQDMLLAGQDEGGRAPATLRNQ